MKRILSALLLIALAVFVALKLFPSIEMRELTIVTIPSGAIISINSVVVGLTPYTNFIPTNGVYVQVEKNGFFEVDSLVTDDIDSLFLQLREGSLLIVNTTPPGCEIHSSNFVGVSPCSIEVVSGSIVEIEAIGEMCISVERVVNVLTPRTRVVNISVPYAISDSLSLSKFVAIPNELLPFPMGNLTVGKSEVTVAQFVLFMNSVDENIVFDSSAVIGRTVLMDSIMKSNWMGQIGFNEDTTLYSVISGMENFPIVGVTQGGAEWYCSWLTQINSLGLEFRLPTATEWELLASQGMDIPVNLSDVNEVILNRHPEIDDGWAETAPAGAMGVNSWGLSEMQGNVWEWTNIFGTAVGGSWLSSIDDCTEFSKIELSSELGYPFVGFRVIATGFSSELVGFRNGDVN